MGAIKSRSPGVSDGRISPSTSRRNDARPSPEMLREKSTKTTTAVPIWAGVCCPHPATRTSAGVTRATIRAIRPQRTAGSMPIQGDLRPQIQLGKLRTLPERRRWQQLAEADVGLPVQRNPLARQRPRLFDLALGRLDLAVELRADGEEGLADGVSLAIPRFERLVQHIELLVRIVSEIRGGHGPKEDEAVEREERPGQLPLVGHQGSRSKLRRDIRVPQQADCVQGPAYGDRRQQ